jgi:2'-5' RNA ligase
MRTFIAIDLPEEARKEISKAQKQLADLKDLKARFVNPEILHFTLKFFGELTDAQVNKVKEALKQIKFKPFKIKLNTLGVFSSQEFARVIWIDILPKEKLAELQYLIDAELEKISFRMEKNFETHITVARVKLVKDKKALIEGLKKIKVKPIEFEIKSFSLKKSTLTEKGPVYEDILKF